MTKATRKIHRCHQTWRADKHKREVLFIIFIFDHMPEEENMLKCITKYAQNYYFFLVTVYSM